MVNKNRDRFIGMGTVPLQEVELSIKEVKRIKNDLKFNAIQIGTHVNDKKLADPEFVSFFEEVAKNDIFVFLHPFAYGKQLFMEQYYLTNLIGNPFYTTVAAANLIFSGIFDRFPNLKFGLSHAGGFLPYQIGRWEHGFKVRKEPGVNIKKNPLEYVKNNFYFDIIIHYEPALEYLINTFGAEKVLLGSDYPYDMGEHNPVYRVKKLGLNKSDEDKIMFENAENLLKKQEG
jgi:aminocarboxymuconate-semialdehyde decarboxylase